MLLFVFEFKENLLLFVFINCLVFVNLLEEKTVLLVVGEVDIVELNRLVLFKLTEFIFFFTVENIFLRSLIFFSNISTFENLSLLNIEFNLFIFL